MPCARPMSHGLLLVVALTRAAHGGFDDDFSGATARLDLFHSGQGTTEIFAVDRLRIEGPWPGSRTGLTTDLGLGACRMDVHDAADGRLLFTAGYSTIFAEWRTTTEAADGIARTFAESLRFPAPVRPFRVSLSARDATNAMQPVWQQAFDPADRAVDRSAPRPGDVLTVVEHGPSAQKVDLLFLGDGYTAAERERFEQDVLRLTQALFRYQPFAARQADFNVRAVFVAADASGITQPRGGTYLRSPLGLSYNALDSDRYVLTLDNRAWRDLAAAAPYDNVILLANHDKYGGGGIYNLYSTAAARSAEAEYLVVHEFGHHFAGLADEYYTSPIAYTQRPPISVEPWEPNATAMHDPTQLKWADLATTRELPTAWPKDDHDGASRRFQERRATLRSEGAAEHQLEALFREERDFVSQLLATQRGVVGAFEGAAYEARGLFRPAIDCVMFSRNDVPFCPVCCRAIERVIDSQTR